MGGVGVGVSSLALCFVESQGVFLRWWLEQGRGHPKQPR